MDNRWVDLLDPTEGEIKRQAPHDLHPSALDHLLRHAGDHEERPLLQSHGSYIFGVFVVPVALRDEDRIFFQEIGLILTEETLLTVRKTPPGGGTPFDSAPAREACRRAEPAGMIAYHLVDELAERYLHLVDSLIGEIEELEDHVSDWEHDRIRSRLAQLRHDMLRIRQTLGPTREAVRRVVDNRVELDGHDELFPREVELHFADADNKLLRASDGLEFCRDLLSGVRDYHQSRIANDQNEVMKRLTAVASLLLLPTLIVGIYGQNFKQIPGGGWAAGFWMSLVLIAITTAAQLVLFKRYRWL